MIGKTILHYKILEKLGEGGMGIVYKAEDTKLNRDVAIKILPPHLLVSDDDRARFNREAKAAAALNHNNIATVYEINEIEGKPFIVMEFVAGDTLDHTIEKAPLKLEDAISITMQIADGLQAAHSKDVVHRDIKASNILLGADNKAKILDFGLAKTSMSTKLTQMGTTIGTVAYMSPEQVRGEEVDHRTDLWSLGVLLYEMIAGHLPFKAEYDQAIFYGIQNENPDPLTAVRTGVPMSLEWIVNKLIAKDPNERYQSAKDLTIDLKAVDFSDSGFSRVSQFSQTIETKTPASRTKSTRVKKQTILPWIIAALTTVLSIVLIFFLQNGQIEESLYVNIALAQNENQKVVRSDMQMIAISPDGNKIVYAASEGTSSSLYIRSLNSFTTKKLEGTENGLQPFFSPDGNWIGFNAAGKMKRVSIHGGGVDIIYNGIVARGACWIDDDTIIFSPSYVSGLLSLSISQNVTKVITSLDSTRKERTHRWPQALPDGEHILYTIGNIDNPQNYENAELAIHSLKDNKKHLLNIRGEMARYVEPGYLLVSKGGTLLAAPFDLDNYKVLSPPLPLINNIDGDISSGINYYGISKKGSIVYIEGNRSQSRELVWIDMQGKITSLNLEKESYNQPKFSPDGKMIVVSIGLSLGSSDIWLYNIENSEFRRFTFGTGNNYPVWSRDSKGIYYISMSKDPEEIKYKSINGNTSKSLWSFSSNLALQLQSISQENRYLTIVSLMGPNEGDIMYLDLQSTKKELVPISILPAFEMGGNFSPDSKYIVYASNETGRMEIYIKSFLDTDVKWQVSKNGGNGPVWSADGKKLYYVNDIGEMMVAPIKTDPFFSPGQAKVLMDFSQIYTDGAYDIHPNGERFIMVRNSRSQTQLTSFNFIYNWISLLDKKLKKD